VRKVELSCCILPPAPVAKPIAHAMRWRSLHRSGRGPRTRRRAYTRLTGLISLLRDMMDRCISALIRSSSRALSCNPFLARLLPLTPSSPRNEIDLTVFFSPLAFRMPPLLSLFLSLSLSLSLSLLERNGNSWESLEWSLYRQTTSGG